MELSRKNFVPNNIIVFKLESPIDAASNTKKRGRPACKRSVFQRSSPGSSTYLKQLYFNMYAKVKTSDGTDLYEMIPCFVDIAENYTGLFQIWDVPGINNNMVTIGSMPPIASSNSYEYGYVVLDLINVGMIEETKKKEGRERG